MKNLTTLATSLALALFICSPAKAEYVASPEPKPAAEPSKMMENHREMHHHKQQMREEIRAQDAVLSEQVTAMNSAPDDKKVGLMAALLTRMVEQRVAMNERKASMENMMMDKSSMSQDAGAAASDKK
jgi:hypothetical protein